MENSFTPARRRALAIAFTLGLLVLVLAWLGRESLWQVAQAASAEAVRLAEECFEG